MAGCLQWETHLHHSVIRTHTLANPINVEPSSSVSEQYFRCLTGLLVVTLSQLMKTPGHHSWAPVLSPHPPLPPRSSSRVCCSALQGGFQEFLRKNKWTLLHRVKFCPPPPPPPPPWRHLSTFPGGRRARRMEGTPSGVIRGQTRALGFSKAKLLSEITAKASAVEP